jgi:hypothetical protein
MSDAQLLSNGTKTKLIGARPLSLMSLTRQATTQPRMSRAFLAAISCGSSKSNLTNGNGDNDGDNDGEDDGGGGGAFESTVPAAVAFPSQASHDVDAFAADARDVFAAKMRDVIARVKKAKRVVIFTGAGASASAGVGTFKGKNAMGSLLHLREDKADGVMPTFTHRCTQALLQAGVVQFVVTSNHDNLHRKAGATDARR